MGMVYICAGLSIQLHFARSNEVRRLGGGGRLLPGAGLAGDGGGSAPPHPALTQL